MPAIDAIPGPVNLHFAGWVGNKATFAWANSFSCDKVLGSRHCRSRSVDHSPRHDKQREPPAEHHAGHPSMSTDENNPGKDQIPNPKISRQPMNHQLSIDGIPRISRAYERRCRRSVNEAIDSAPRR